MVFMMRFDLLIYTYSLLFPGEIKTWQVFFPNVSRRFIIFIDCMVEIITFPSSTRDKKTTLR